VNIEKVLSYDEWQQLQALVRRVPVADSVIRYAMQFARLTRQSENMPDFIRQYVSWGAGPRASQYLILGAKARAILHGRPYAGVQDVQAVAAPVLRHRILTNFNAEAERVRPDDIVQKLIALIPEDGSVSHLLPKMFKTA
jgi:MoxR-like ATPase